MTDKLKCLINGIPREVEASAGKAVLKYSEVGRLIGFGSLETPTISWISGNRSGCLARGETVEFNVTERPKFVVTDTKWG